MTVNKVHDAASGNWVDRYAPTQARPYLRMMRVDRPIGVWLFFAPFTWSLMMAAPAFVDFSFWYAALFFVFAMLIRGAGCIINDIVDRDLDALVERTRSRPLPSGQISVRMASLLGLITTLVGLLIAKTISVDVFYLSFVLIVLTIIYPMTKRVIWWPQAVLAITFNWGVLLAWVAVTGELSTAAGLLYVGAAFWIFAYDTVYAHQDKLDDAKVNVKSSALALGDKTRGVVLLCYGLALLCIAAAGMVSGFNLIYIAALLPAAWLLISPIIDIDFDDPNACLNGFIINKWVGLWVFVAIAIGSFTKYGL